MIDSSIPQPDQVAYKLASARSGRNPQFGEQLRALPRLAEALWFLEWRRRQPGGLQSFTEELVAYAGDSILPSEFLSVETDRLGRFVAEDIFGILSRLPAWLRPSIPDDLRDKVEFALAAGVVDLRTASEAGLDCGTIVRIREWLTKEACLKECAAKCPARLHQFLTNFVYGDLAFPESLTCGRTWDEQRDRLQVMAAIANRLRRAEEARDPSLMKRESIPQRPKPFAVMSKIPELLIRFMESHAAKHLNSVAQTEVTKQVLEAIRFAAESKSLVLVTGNSRYGKTESTTAMCNARPGLVRLVHTPSATGEKEFLLRVAEAVGYGMDQAVSLPRLREKVCLALRHGGLTLIFDESSFLIPSNYSRTTVPARLNFVRLEIVDAGLGCVLIATPQAHRDSIDKFVRKTRYAMEQWLGRVDSVYTLPERLSLTDMLQVVKVRLPGISEQNARLIAGRAAQTDQCLHAVTSILKRARWLAEQRGPGEDLIAQDVNKASDEFIAGVCGEIYAATDGRSQRSVKPAPDLAPKQSADRLHVERVNQPAVLS